MQRAALNVSRQVVNALSASPIDIDAYEAACGGPGATSFAVVGT